jgi:hypothetical protein
MGFLSVFCDKLLEVEGWAGLLGALIHRLSSSHKGFEAGDLILGTKDYKGVTRANSVLGRGGSVELALRTEDGEDHGTGPVSDL